MLGQLAKAVSKDYQDKANCGKMFSFISKILPGFNGCCVFEPVAHHSYFIDLTPPDSPLFLKMKKDNLLVGDHYRSYDHVISAVNDLLK